MSEKERHIKVLIVKPGFDGHWRGATVVSLALRDAGMEVIYGGNLAPVEIGQAAIQEGVDVVGLSILAASHMRLASEVMRLLREGGAEDVMVVIGGTIPREDIPELKKIGISEVFLPGTPLEEIIRWTKENVKPK